MNSPVALIFFNRPESTARVFAKIKEAKPPRLYLIADGPRVDHPEDFDKTVLARKHVEYIDWNCKVTRIYSDNNLGCGYRLPTGLDIVFESESELIILEDDCVPDISLFRFCDEMLERYQNEEQVMMISGRNGFQKWKEDSQSYHFSRLGSIWGWATWKRAWKYYDHNMKAWGDSILRDRIRLAMGEDREFYFRKNEYDKVYYEKMKSTWDYQWLVACHLKNGLTIIPAVNLIENIGFGRNSTHTDLVVLENDLMKARRLSFPLILQKNIESDEEFDRKSSITNPPPPLPRKPIWVLRLYLILPQSIRPLFYRQYLRIYSLFRKLSRVSFAYIYGKLITCIQRWKDYFKFNDLNRLYPEYWFAQRKNGEWNSDVRKFCKTIFNSFTPTSVADVGCGPGVYLRVFKEFGVNKIFGLEGTDNALKSAVVNVIQKQDLRLPFKANIKYELVLCLEVAEHIHYKYAGILVDTVTELCLPGGTIVFTAAVPGQGGFHHINLQPREFWIDKFSKRRCRYNDSITVENSKMLDLKVLSWLQQNLMVFIRDSE